MELKKEIIDKNYNEILENIKKVENKKEFLYMQIFSNTLYMIQYFILGAFSASLANAVGATRGFIFYKEENKS